MTAPADPAAGAASIELSDAAVTVEIGFSRQLSATVKSAAGNALGGIPVTWSSDNPAVAQVADGNITPVATGTARVSASAAGKTASATVTVVPTVVISVKLSRTKATLSPSGALQLTGQSLDARDRPISGRSIAFESTDGAVASVSAAGLITAKGIGSTIITATSDTKTASMRVEIVAPTMVSIPVSGSVPTGLPAMGRYTVSMRHEDDSLITKPVSAAGALTGPMLLADTIEFVADVNSESPFDAWPSRYHAARNELPASVPVVFIPPTFTLKSGAFAGTSVMTYMAAATIPCPGVGDYQCYDGFYPASFRFGVVAWPTLPVAVAMSALTSSDSTILWDALHGMENIVGRQLFVADAGSTPNRITAFIGLPPGSPSNVGGEAQWAYDGQGRILTASVWFRTRLTDSQSTRNVIQHEFIHALGFMHTCAWPSVMGGYGCALVPMSADDAAYILLARGIFEAEKKIRLEDGSMPCGEMGVWSAIAGQRVTVSCNGDSQIFGGDWSLVPRLSKILSPNSIRLSPVVQ